MAELLELMARLRDPEGGCPWDRAQGFETIAPYTIEEAYEVADAIARGHREDLREELGDLLFQVVFHARLAEEEGAFGFAEVVDAIVDKMTRRHPHVFAGASVPDAQGQARDWEAHKALERRWRGAPAGTLAGVARGLPALKRAEKLQRRAARVGFDWTDARAVIPKLREEIGELEAALDAGDPPARLREELGDLLFTCVNLARHIGADPDRALREASSRFEDRFTAMEAEAGREGLSLESFDAAALEALWSRAKDTSPES